MKWLQIIGCLVVLALHPVYGDDGRQPTIVIGVEIGADVNTPYSKVVAVAARACALNADYPVPFGLGKDCNVGPVNDPESGSNECRVFGYSFICVGD